MNKTVRWGAAALLAALLAVLFVRGNGTAGPPAAASAVRGPAQLSFVVTGCNRVGFSVFEQIQSEDPSGANLPQLRQTFADVANLRPVPPLFFFTGDLVVAEEADQGEALTTQLDAWFDVFSSAPSGISQKTNFVPIVGNHEVLQSLEADSPSGSFFFETPNNFVDAVWLNWIEAHGFDRFAGNGPTPQNSPQDLLGDDQSKFTYSFNVGAVHFVVLNTDSFSTTQNIGWIPMAWLSRDIQQAQANRQIRTILILGHKPIVSTYRATVFDAAPAIINPLANQLQALMLANPKVVAYLCAHNHEWHLFHLAGPGSPWQVIAGNAGSELDENWNPPGGPFFGFTLVNVYRDGSVGINPYGRPVPNPYYEPPTQPARPRGEILLSRRG